MSLNKFMHQRNPYKGSRPDFKALALKYKVFREVATTDLRGEVALDFKNPECLKALTWCLLKENHDLDIDIPLDRYLWRFSLNISIINSFSTDTATGCQRLLRPFLPIFKTIICQISTPIIKIEYTLCSFYRLIPTIPLRLNYILWIEDLIGQSTAEAADVHGVDIGTGATCIYPLIGAKRNNWSFVATETNETSLSFAKHNVIRNDLQGKIQGVILPYNLILC